MEQITGKVGNTKVCLYISINKLHRADLTFTVWTLHTVNIDFPATLFLLISESCFSSKASCGFAFKCFVSGLFLHSPQILSDCCHISERWTRGLLTQPAHCGDETTQGPLSRTSILIITKSLFPSSFPPPSLLSSLSIVPALAPSLW